MSTDDERRELNDRIAALDPDQRALLLARLKAQGGRPEAEAVGRRAPDVPAPLSFGQHGIWLAEQFRPSVASNLMGAIRLTGPLDLDVLRQGLRHVIDRHEILRTTFEIRAGGPVQVVHPTSDHPLAIVDLSELDEARRDEAWRRRAAEEGRRRFDLAEGPLFRLVLFRLSDDHHVLVVPVHHIIFDGFSVGIFSRELGESYAWYHAGAEPRLPDLDIQYGDFAADQVATADDLTTSQLEFWKEALAADLPILDLPTDRPRPPIPAHHGALETSVLPADLVARLESLSQEQGATMFMTLLAAFQVLLGRYSGQDDVIVGTSIRKRNRPETWPLIGFFLNMLPLRTDLSGRPTTAELLRRVRDVCAGAFAHSDVPYHRLIAELRPERDLSRNTLFQTQFQLLPPTVPPEEIAGLRGEMVDVDPGAVWTDLDVSIKEDGRGLVVSVVYATELFDASTIRRMLDHYRVLLDGMAHHPGLPVDSISLLTEEERNAQVAWNRTVADYDREATVHGLFERQVERNPDAVAVTCGTELMTYAVLEGRANRLARHLRAEGVHHGALVGVCLDRSVDVPVALLAVLKAGGAYLPLDASHPGERLRYILEDAGVSAVVTEPSLRSRLPADIVCIDCDPGSIGEPDTDADLDRSAERPGQGTAADDLAYVMYTSGSTGRPKGVEVRHRSVVNFLTSMAREPGIDAGDTLLAVTTISFDISVLELFLPLTVGSTVAIAPSDIVSDGHRLMEQIASSGATIMQATPSTWRMILQAGWPGSRELKVLCGGEPLPRDLAKELVRRCGTAWNMYGPTETTIWSTCGRLDEPDDSITIGRPVANTQLRVLDRALLAQPVGVPGELYIGGDGLARGYRGRPELTAERFVSDPFTPGESRLYRTGDLVRWDEDGRLHHLKRLDDQVKVRGHRIELGEIEAVLHAHPSVATAAVVARTYGPGDVRLIGYVVRDGDDEPDPQALREHLGHTLPAPMVPSLWVSLDELPRMANGKIDRGALPSPEHRDVGGGATSAPPETPDEKAVAATFRDHLGVARVGVHDNFFDLGGHSLLVITVILDIERRTGHRPGAADLALQTVGQLAADCARARESGGSSSAGSGASDVPAYPEASDENPEDVASDGASDGDAPQRPTPGLLARLKSSLLRD